MRLLGAVLLLILSFRQSQAQSAPAALPLCLSLQGSASCPAFQDQYVSPQNLARYYDFFYNVSNVATFDSQLLSYIYGSYAAIKYGNEFGCPNFNSASDYARWTLTWLCGVFTQNTESYQCNQANGVTPKRLCTQTCTEFAYSQASIVSNDAICGTDRSGGSRQFWLNQDSATCTNWTSLATQNPNSGTCIVGNQNEGNCGFGSDTVALCNYCNPSTNTNADPCCYSNATRLSNCRYTQSLPSPTATSTASVVSSPAVGVQNSALAAAEASILASGFSAITSAFNQYISTAGGSVVSGYFGTTTLANPTLILAPIASSAFFSTAPGSSATSNAAPGQAAAAVTASSSPSATAATAQAADAGGSGTGTTTAANGGGLSGGQIVGIALGCVALVAITLVLMACVCTRRYRRRRNGYSSKSSNDSLASEGDRFLPERALESRPMVQTYNTPMVPPPTIAPVPQMPIMQMQAPVSPPMQVTPQAPMLMQGYPQVPPMAAQDNRPIVASAIDPGYYVSGDGRSSPRLFAKRQQRPGMDSRRRSMDDTRRQRGARRAKNQPGYEQTRPFSQIGYLDPRPLEPLALPSMPMAYANNFYRPISPATSVGATYANYGPGYNVPTAPSMSGMGSAFSGVEAASIPPRRASIIEATHFPDHNGQLSPSSPIFMPRSPGLPHQEQAYRRTEDGAFVPIQGFAAPQDFHDRQYASQHPIMSASPPASITGRSQVSVSRRTHLSASGQNRSSYPDQISQSLASPRSQDFSYTTAHASPMPQYQTPHGLMSAQQLANMYQLQQPPMTTVPMQQQQVVPLQAIQEPVEAPVVPQQQAQAPMVPQQQAQAPMVPQQQAYSNLPTNGVMQQAASPQVLPPSNIVPAATPVAAVIPSQQQTTVVAPPSHQQTTVAAPVAADPLKEGSVATFDNSTKPDPMSLANGISSATRQVPTSGPVHSEASDAQHDDLHAAIERLAAEENKKMGIDVAKSHKSSSGKRRAYKADKVQELVIPKRSSDAYPAQDGGVQVDQTRNTNASNTHPQIIEPVPRPGGSQSTEPVVPSAVSPNVPYSSAAISSGQNGQTDNVSLAPVPATLSAQVKNVIPRVPVQTYIPPVESTVAPAVIPSTPVAQSVPQPAAVLPSLAVSAPVVKPAAEQNNRRLASFISKARAKASGKNKDKALKGKSNEDLKPDIQRREQSAPAESKGTEAAEAKTGPVLKAIPFKLENDGIASERRSSIVALAEPVPEPTQTIEQSTTKDVQPDLKNASSSTPTTISETPTATSRAGTRPNTRPNSRPNSFSGSNGKGKSVKSGSSVITAFQDRFSDHPILNQSVVIVIHAYNGTLVDELTLVPGGEVVVKKMYDDGWAIGTIADPNNPQITRDGAFPLVCVTSKAAFQDSQYSSESEKLANGN